MPSRQNEKGTAAHRQTARHYRDARVRHREVFTSNKGQKCKDHNPVSSKRKNTPPRLSERGAVEQSHSHRSPGYNAPQLLSVSETTRTLGIGRRLLAELTREGSVPSVKVGGRRLYSARELEKWIDAGCPRVAGKGASHE
ncbi:MAG: DNA-binding protein [Phycisphaeraceae bacterium]|nr:MAG: DNA-binding protein [Phycisphaeraceae bacterium]